MNGKLRAIVRREYLETVRTKGFAIGTILGPLLMSAMMFVPVMIARQGGEPLRVAVLDLAGGLQEPVEQALRQVRSEGRPGFDVQPGPSATAAEREAALKQAVLQGALDGYVELGTDAPTGKATYYGRNVSRDLRSLERAVEDVLVTRRLVAAGMDPARVSELTRELDLRTVKLSKGVEREDTGRSSMMFSITLMMMLYGSIIMWGQHAMIGVIEEKGSRVIEVLASGLAPSQLLAGKLLGLGAAGLTQFIIWALSILLLSVFGTGLSVGDFSMPDVSPLVLVSFVLFFVLGFLFYAALYAAIGSAVNNIQEAQSLAFPVMVPILAAMVSFPAAIENPDGPLAVTLSMIPGMSPLIMFLRIVVQTPPLWQVALSIVLLALAIWGVVWVSARIYRVGILMYGKKPTFPELMKWVTHP